MFLLKLRVRLPRLSPNLRLVQKRSVNRCVMSSLSALLATVYLRALLLFALTAKALFL